MNNLKHLLNVNQLLIYIILQAIYATENSKNLASDAENIQEESFLMLDAVREAALHARDSVLSIEELADVLIAGEGQPTTD